jgi:hypothetical protein
MMRKQTCVYAVNYRLVFMIYITIPRLYPLWLTAEQPKLLYTQCKTVIKGAIADIAIALEATDSDDISYDTIVEKL